MRTVQKLLDLSHRVAVITGGAGHLGRMMGEALGELGATVVLVDQRPEVNEAVAQLPGSQAHEGIQLDLSRPENVEQLTKRMVEQHGRADILINNAAFTSASNLSGWAVPIEQQTATTWRAALEINLTVPFLLMQAFAPLLRESGSGVVINIASIYGLVGPQFSLYHDTTMGNPAAYNASKAGLLQLTRYFATAFAPDIRVNAISPGGIARDQPKAFTRRYCERTPLRRMATEEDFKGAIVYLASDLSAYMTGQNLIVDGGWTIW